MRLAFGRVLSVLGFFWFSAHVVAADESAPAKRTVVPCLAVAADGSPVWESTAFPSTKRITATFQLPDDSSAKTIESRWIALGGDTEGVIAENKLDLNGQKSGWLRLELKQPAPPGKYRLDTLLDGKAWESVELTVVEPPTDGAAGKVADFVVLEEGTTREYDMLIRPGEGTKIDVPGSTMGPDGVIRASVAVAIGKTENGLTHYQGTINGQNAGEMWVKLDEKGLSKVRQKDGEQTRDINPPQVIQPLPPKLEDGIEWTSPSTNNGELKLTMFGPLKMRGPDGATTGYLIFSEEDLTASAPGSDTARGRETIERYFVPKFGLIRQVNVTKLGGKATSRHDLLLVPDAPYALVPDPSMKGRLGRVSFKYPRDAKASETRVAVFKSGGTSNDKPIHSGYGDDSFDVMPGKYEVSVNKVRIPVEVKSAHVTVPRCGVLRVHAGSETKFRILDGKKTELYTGYGETDVVLPRGEYTLEIAGATERVKIAEGQILDF